ncbi:PQQ-like beta-propeller repeat protein [Opitutales bacterium]|nr:PQQ-like beta-propeller repeat protein [Opitutales bacterium]
MIPHFGFSKGKTLNDERSRDFYRPPLRDTSENWNQFRGPERNGHIPLQSVSTDWTKPPKTRWSTPCGLGHSSIITSGRLAITMEQDQDQEILIARSFEDGQEAWRVAEKTKWHDMLSGTGPRSTPTLHNGKLYTLFSHGKLSRVDASSGNVEWSIQVTSESYEFPEWGLAISPLIWNDMIILSLGGEKSAIKAYLINSGEQIWQSEVSGKAVYLSPEVLRLLDEDHLIVSLVGKIVSLDPMNGKTLWEKPWKIFMNNVQIVQPIAVSNDSIVMAAGYGKGAECFSISRDEESKKYRVQSSWKSKDLKAKFSNPILKDGYLYGLSENLLVCLEAKTGKLMWRGKKYSYGRILLVDQKLLILGHSGVLSVIDSTPEEFREISSRQLLSNARCWNGPAFVNGYLLARNGEQIACFDFGK